jgi:hypothetical protein
MHWRDDFVVLYDYTCYRTALLLMIGIPEEPTRIIYMSTLISFITISEVLCDLLFSRNQPLKSADD